MMEVPPKWDLVFCEESLPLQGENNRPHFSHPAAPPKTISPRGEKNFPSHWRQWLTPTWELHLQESLQPFFLGGIFS